MHVVKDTGNTYKPSVITASLDLDMKRRQKEINKLLEEGDSPTLHYKVKQTMRPINFMNPNSGMRLGVFNSFDARKEVMPSRKPNLTEVGYITI